MVSSGWAGLRQPHLILIVALFKKKEIELHFSRDEVIKIGSNVFGGSPGDKLYTSLGNRGMNVAELVTVLDQLRLETVLMFLKEYGWYLCLYIV